MAHVLFELTSHPLSNLQSCFRPEGFVTVPYRKAQLQSLTPRQRQQTRRCPVGTTSPGEAWNRWARRRIWIDPNHHWDVGNGRIGRADVERAFIDRGLQIEGLTPLSCCDYWVLRRPAA